VLAPRATPITRTTTQVIWCGSRLLLSSISKTPIRRFIGFLLTISRYLCTISRPVLPVFQYSLIHNRLHNYTSNNNTLLEQSCTILVFPRSSTTPSLTRVKAPDRPRSSPTTRSPRDRYTRVEYGQEATAGSRPTTVS